MRLIKEAGAVPFGRTSMSEFAYSGVGLNPHYGTPGNVFDPEGIPGGSSSGAGVSAGLGLVDIAMGTDTGGSIEFHPRSMAFMVTSQVAFLCPEQVYCRWPMALILPGLWRAILKPQFRCLRS